MKEADDKKVIDIEYEVNLYSKLYDILVNLDKVEDEHMTMAKTGFYNCMAKSARLSFGTTMDEVSGCYKLSKLAKDFMYLSGLDEEPDEMHWVLASIEWHAAGQYHGILSSGKRTYSETQYKELLIRNFSTINQFKIFQFISKEARLKHGDRIDILCKEILSERPVIVELKLGAKSAHKQLRSYAVSFDNPILINISEKLPPNKRDDISYYTYDELLPMNQFPFESFCDMAIADGLMIPNSGQQKRLEGK